MKKVGLNKEEVNNKRLNKKGLGSVPCTEFTFLMKQVHHECFAKNWHTNPLSYAQY
jgi:hypothetical protein